MTITINKKKAKAAFETTEEAQIDILLNEMLQELEEHEVTKKKIILKYADELASIMGNKEDVGVELISGLKHKGYRIHKGYVYKVLKESGRNYCRGFEKVTIESGDRPLSKDARGAENHLQVPAPQPFTQADYDLSVLVDKLQAKIKDLENNNQQLLKEIDKMRIEKGFKWFSAPIPFVEKHVNRYKEQGLPKIWFIAEEGYIVNIVDREPQDQQDAESMI